MNTPTDNDKELFELCKQVYKSFGWFHVELRVFTSEGYVREPNAKKSIFIDEVPLYTSDYLLEKLPKEVNNYWLTLQYSPLGEPFCASYDSGLDALETIYENSSDTPLKAILKLTLDLHEVGKL